MNSNHKYSAPGIGLLERDGNVTVVVHPTSSDTDQSVEKKPKASGSPETWSTNSDSPTPTNSVSGRIWNKDILWQGLLGDEHRQLLGTEEESSDRHSSDDDIETDFQSIYQMNSEQFEYYKKQFSVIQPNEDGLVSGHIARVFFEKSRIPVEELRQVWQLCDVTKDGALSLAEFAAAMHLVVLKRNNISLPNVLPPCLNPSTLIKTVKREEVVPNTKEDLLDLDLKEKRINVHERTFKDDVHKKVSAPTIGVRSKANDLISPANDDTCKAQSSRNSPILETVTPPTTKGSANQSRQWTKFLESPTSCISTPGLKPVNFDMQRTAQAVVSDPQILHPVPLRVTPVDTLESDLNLTHRRLEPFHNDVSGGPIKHDSSNISKRNKPPYDDSLYCTTSSPKDFLLPTDLCGVQLTHAKKNSMKNGSAIPPSNHIASNNMNDTPLNLLMKDPPPPPPRPYRHMRSSSLDLSKLKLNAMEFLFQNTSGMLQTEVLDNTMELKSQSELITSFKSTQHASAFEVYRKPMVQIISHSTDSLQPDQEDQCGREIPASKDTSVFGSSDSDRRVPPLNEHIQQLQLDNGVNLISFLRDFKQRNLLLIHLCQNLSIELLSIQQRKEEIRNKLNSFVKTNRMNVCSKIALANAANE